MMSSEIFDATVSGVSCTVNTQCSCLCSRLL